MVSVLLHAQGDWNVPGALLERGVREVLRREGVDEGEISLALLDDARMEALNLEYLGKSGPTDVIAFALHAPGEAPLGDVYVGYEQARRQAVGLNVQLDEELLRLAVHGTLHVLGHTHPEGDEGEGSPMFLLQEELLAQILASGAPEVREAQE